MQCSQDRITSLPLFDHVAVYIIQLVQVTVLRAEHADDARVSYADDN